MSDVDPLTPVLVGVSQLSRRPQGADDLNDPASLMVEAARLAGSDSGSSSALDRVKSIRVVESLGWRPPNAAAVLTRALGLEPVDLVLTATGGNGPLSLLHDTCAAISRGQLDAALLVGAEAFYSRRVARTHGVEAPESPSDADEPPRVIGDQRVGSHPAELGVGLTVPAQVYPLFSTARSRSLGDSTAALHPREAEVWSRFAEVASRNPYAWSRQAYSAEEIAEASPDNRMVAHPYTKRCCANIQVDQGAAAIVMSAGAAEAAGVPRERWVFPWAGAEANDHWFVSERMDLHSSPAIAECWKMLRQSTNVDPDDISLIDLYSCFPAAVAVAADEMGLDLADAARPLTLTGGLAFAGGPGNNYSMHSLATLVGRLRVDGGLGLVTGVGWYLTKHALSLLSATPPPEGFRHGSPQPRVDARPKRSVVAGADDLSLETFTVFYDRDGAPTKAAIAGVSDQGARGWLTSDDPRVLNALVSDQEISLSDCALP
ncbi:MAG: hypothetical protein KY395_05225 [Actinobacteria bacterium]|nr:hypothetical protein [Actinomycetota bacterium]